MKEVTLAEAEHNLAEFLRLAKDEDIVLTQQGRPVGVLVGFTDEDDWFEYQLENNEQFLQRIAEARADLRLGRGTRLEDVNWEESQ